MHSSYVKAGTEVHVNSKSNTLHIGTDMTVSEVCRLVKGIYPKAIYIGRNGYDGALCFKEEETVQFRVPKGNLKVVYNIGESLIVDDWKLKDGDVVYIEKKPYAVRKEGKTYALLPV